MTAVLDAALLARQHGFCPIRPRTDGSKAPLGAWAEWMHHRPIEAEVREWFAEWPGIGVVCGAISGNLECFELEGRAIHLWKPLRERMHQAGLGELFQECCDGYIERTPSGGLHVLWRLAEGEEVPGNTKLASRVTDEGVEVLIETRGEAGFVIVSPSNDTTHPTGGSWTIVRGGFATVRTITRDQRDAIVRIAESFDEMPAMIVPPPPRSRAGTQPREGSGWVESALGDWTQANSIEDVLLRNGWQYLEQDGLGTLWRRPGKARGSCSARVNLNSRLHVFSTSTPFIAGQRHATTYDALDVELTYRLGRPPSSDERVACLRAETDQAPSNDFSWVTVTERPAAVPVADQSDATGTTSTAGVHHHQEGEAPSVAGLILPEEFWDARPHLRQLRIAAHSRMASPDGVWGAFKSRYATTIPKTLMIPAIVQNEATFDYITVLVSPSGGGKTGAMAIARSLLNLDPDDYPRLLFDPPPGSGEGVIDAMIDHEELKIDGKTVKRQIQILDGIHMMVDEGSMLADLAGRKGNILAQTLTAAWSGQGLGQLNVKGNRRQIDPGQARITVVMGIQTALGVPLVSDFAASLGLTQRMVFSSTMNPAVQAMVVDGRVMKPDWPGPLDVALLNPNSWSIRHPIKVHPEVVREIELRHAWDEAHQDQIGLDGHRYLCQLKTAGILMFMDDRRETSIEDWELARIDTDASRKVRNTILESDRLSAQRRTDIRVLAKVGETLAIEDATVARSVDRGARAMGRRVARDEEPVTRRELHYAVASRDRKAAGLEEMIEYAISRGWVVDIDGSRFVKGDSTPS